MIGVQWFKDGKEYRRVLNSIGELVNFGSQLIKEIPINNIYICIDLCR